MRLQKHFQDSLQSRLVQYSIHHDPDTLIGSHQSLVQDSKILVPTTSVSKSVTERWGVLVHLYIPRWGMLGSMGIEIACEHQLLH